VPLGWRGRSRPTSIPTDYTQFLDTNGLRGARVGVTRQGVDNAPPQVAAAFDAAVAAIEAAGAMVVDLDAASFTFPSADGEFLVLLYDLDRKSTRLNSSHGSISYAVFCLKKKNNAT